MKLIVGLGNPGSRYADSRHNIGREVVTAFARSHGIALNGSQYRGRFGAGRANDLDVVVLLPETFMNLSGESLGAALSGLPDVDPARDLVVVYDDLDLPFARIRIRSGGGAGGQKGLAHIIESLGRRDFSRLRFGIGRPASGEAIVDYVLSGFSPEEAHRLPEHIERAVAALDVVLAEGPDAAMNRFNQVIEEFAEPSVPAPAPAPVESEIVPPKNFISRFIGWFRRKNR